MSGDTGDFFDRFFDQEPEETAEPSPTEFPAPPEPVHPKSAPRTSEPTAPPETPSPQIGVLEQVINAALAQFQRNSSSPEIPELIRTLRMFDRGKITRELDRRVGNPPNPEIEGLALRIFLELGPPTEDTCRQQWANVTLDDPSDLASLPALATDSIPLLGPAATLDVVLETLDSQGWPKGRSQPGSQYFNLPVVLRYTLQECVPQDLLLKFVLQLMDRLPAEKRTANLLPALGPFQDERVLNWIESHATDPITYEWGAAAAVSGLSWERICAWLDKGRPLSLVALDAMKNCRGFDPNDPEMSGIFKVASPKVLHPATRKRMRKRLEQYARRDPEPRVKRAVAMILEHLPQIVES